MKKTLGLILIVAVLFIMVPWSFAQSDSDRQLAELLAEMQWTAWENNEEEETLEDMFEDLDNFDDFNLEEWEDLSENQDEEHLAAEAILDMIEWNNWSFAWTQRTEIIDITPTSITIETTSVLFDGTPVDTYLISYSNTTIADLSNFQDIMLKEVEVEERNGDMVTVILDDLEPETPYYFIVSPVHPTDPTADGFSMWSQEINVTTAAIAPEITSNTILFQNISHTQESNLITVTWTPTDLVENWLLEIRHSDETTFTRVGTVSMISWSYPINVSQPWNYFIKLQWVADDGSALWAEQIHNIKVEEFEQPENPVQTAPQVWPTTDLIMMLFILAFIVYFVYRFRKAER